MDWFDAHLDLAYLAVCGRDMTLPLERMAAGPAIAANPKWLKPAAITLPSLREGGVRWAVATIFVDPASAKEPAGYGGAEDVSGARQAGEAQLRVYQEWEAHGLVRIIRRAGDLSSPKLPPGQEPLNIIILMEGADPIGSPDEAQWWFEQGVRVVGLAWRQGSRYAGGNDSPAERGGLTDAGRALVKQLDHLGIIHDLSHLHDAAAEQLLERVSGPVIASHTTSRRLMGATGHRLISDALMREVGRREGVIGLALYSKFLTPVAGRASIHAAVDHVEHIAQVMGRRDAVGLGSDMDGGFSADHLPQGIDKPADLGRLAEMMLERGWTPTEVAGFREGNWLRFFRARLPG